MTLEEIEREEKEKDNNNNKTLWVAPFFFSTDKRNLNK